MTNSKRATMWVHPDFKKLIKGYAYSNGDKVINLTKKLADDNSSYGFEQLRIYRDKIKK